MSEENQLPIINPVTSCDDCGACCTEIGTPPGYIAVLLTPERWPEDSGDHERVAQLPLRARLLLYAYLASYEDREGLPCLWYDTETKKCQFYEHRPSICREFEVGSETCLKIREQPEEIRVVDYNNRDAQHNMPGIGRMRMSLVFEEWQRRYQADPAAFEAEMSDGDSHLPLGLRMARYFEGLASELDAAGKLPKPAAK